VEIDFEDEDLEADCNEHKRLVRRFNVQRAKLIRRRLDDLRAAPNLATMRGLPGRCHELKGNRKWQLTVDLDRPHRLVFTPAANPMPQKDDGGLDWEKVTAIRILEVTDTHE
jgi:plasmid maintenance system killer protein